ncbi:OmpA family protein [Noviherbaspirillum pedocola]|uniref:OmpA family protein n=1 Tax=Noviherbaspirillum pedocola TaxID=2801341 RepID=A0A934STD4_9BURK|nr:OmpA family protein [Noviherbaspirillum pedocola]MBK4735292.1 OmpA family protein [Noviherbaspirillum pedocola]
MLKTPRMYRLILASALAVPLTLLTSCAVHQTARQETTASFDQALDAATDDLIAQTQKLPVFLNKVEAKLNKLSNAGIIVVDPMLDGASGQQTEVTKKAEQRLVQRVQARFPQFSVLPFNAEDMAKAQYVLNGTITRMGNGASYRLNLALTEVKTGVVLAQAGARIAGSALDTSPTPFYRDSPALSKDRVVEGYIRTSQTSAGQPADPVYLERLPTSALLAEANAAYNADRLTDALNLYEAAAKRPDGQQLRVYNGLYLANWQLRRTAEAEKAFSVIAQLGLATNNLSVRFLFKPGSTDFLADPKITAPYPMWIRQIARQAAQAGQCVNVIGHTSRTGSEQTNERLSLQRADVVKKRLEQEDPGLAGKLREEGLGFRENIIGTGTDDSRDALDRRVEFRVISCGAA